MHKKYNNIFHYLTIVLFFLLFTKWTLSLRYDTFPTTQEYFFLFLYTLILFLFQKRRENKKLSLKLTDIIAFSFIAIWIYGLIRGLLLNIPTILVVRNFFGMSLYYLYFLMIFFYNPKKKLSQVLIISSLTATTLIIISLITQYPDNLLLLLGKSRLIYSYLNYFPIIILPLLLLHKFKINTIKSFLISSLYILATLLIILSSIVTMNSKGMYLALFFILLITLYIKNRKIFILLLWSHSILFLFDSLYPLDFLTPFYRKINLAFQPQFTNESRYWQAAYLLNEFSVLGKGLGSTLLNGYIRDPKLTYGYELTLFNFLHKFGVAGFILISNYILTFYILIKNLIKMPQNLCLQLSLGCSVFFFMGIGNPALFAPIAVFFHCIILYFLRDIESQQHN